MALSPTDALYRRLWRDDPPQYAQEMPLAFREMRSLLGLTRVAEPAYVLAEAQAYVLSHDDELAPLIVARLVALDVTLEELP